MAQDPRSEHDGDGCRVSNFAESVVEDAALTWLNALGYTILHGPEIAAGEPGAERTDPNYRDVILEQRLRKALEQLNPALPPEAIEDAYRRLTRGRRTVVGHTEPCATPATG